MCPSPALPFRRGAYRSAGLAARWFAAALVVAGPASLRAQDNPQRVAFTPTLGSVAAELPFDEPFFLVMKPLAVPLDSVRVLFVRVPAWGPPPPKVCPALKDSLPAATQGRWDATPGAPALAVTDEISVRVAPLTRAGAYAICTRVFARVTRDVALAKRDSTVRAVEDSLNQVNAAASTVTLAALSGRPVLTDGDTLQALTSASTSSIAGALRGAFAAAASPREAGDVEVRVDTASALAVALRLTPAPPGAAALTRQTALARQDTLARLLKVRDIAETQRALLRQRPVLDAAAAAAERSLLRLKGNPELTRAVAAHRAGGLRALDEAALVAGQLVAPGAGVRYYARGLRGLGPTSAAIATGQTYEQYPGLTDEANGRLASLDTTVRALAAVRAFAVATTAGDPAARDRLVAAIDATSDTVDAVRSPMVVIRDALVARRAAVAATVAVVQEGYTLNTRSQGSSVGTLEARTKRRVTADVGAAWAPRLGAVMPYAGVNVYLRPINKRVPLYAYRPLRERVARSFAFTAGFTLGNLQKANVREGLVGERQALLVGGGFRFYDWARVTGGTLVYRAVSPTPADAARRRTRSTAFTALSIDFDVQTAFGRVFSVLNP